MKKAALFFIFIISILLLLAGCEKAECKKDEHCVKEGYEGKCANKKCSFEKLCGGKVCKKTVIGSTLLENYCVNDAVCTTGIPPSKVKLSSLTTEQSLAGDKFKIITNFNQPFNIRKDLFEIALKLSQQAATNSEQKISRIELTGTTKDKRTLTLAEKKVDRYLWTEGSETKVPLIIDFPTADLEGEFTSIMLKIYYNYVQTSGTVKQTRENTLQQNYVVKFLWARPEKPYACPPVCPKETSAMKGTCSPETGFCEYTPVPNQCGNYLCEQNENKCNCKQDCGLCEGSAGVYMTKACTADNNCVGAVKQGVVSAQKTIFDDQNKGHFHLQNNYYYKNPFNVKTDKFVLDINLYQIQQGVSGVKIETIRLLDGAQQIAEIDVNKALPNVSSVIKQELQIPQQSLPEIDKNLLVGVWYQFTQNNQVQKGNFQKPLERITILSPD